MQLRSVVTNVLEQHVSTILNVRPLMMTLIGCQKMSVTTNIGCVTPQKNKDLWNN